MIVLKRTRMDLKDIKIKSWYKYPSKEKLKAKYYFYYKNKILMERIIVDKNNYLLDGYTSYIIAEKENLKNVEVFKETENKEKVDVDNYIQEKSNMYTIDNLQLVLSIILVVILGIMIFKGVI